MIIYSNTGWTEEKINKYIDQGRGQGELGSYRPWLTIQDVASSGRVHRLKGWKTGRIHHLLSDLERDYFFLLDWADNVIDIREQFPLNREKTIKIAEEKGIKHPLDNQTQTPIVMTTDFLITIRENTEIKYLARTIKPSEKLMDKRTIEKFEIERRYWEDEKSDWGIVTELDIPKNYARNISLIHEHFILNDEEVQLAHMFYEELYQSKLSVLEEARIFDEKYLLGKGASLSLFKYLLAHKYIKMDMNNEINFQIPATELHFTEESLLERKIAFEYLR